LGLPAEERSSPKILGIFERRPRRAENLHVNRREIVEFARETFDFAAAHVPFLRHHVPDSMAARPMLGQHIQELSLVDHLSLDQELTEANWA
jgi:hypothetical protein